MDATPIVSNLEVKTTGGAFEVTGDITNAGLSTANAVTVTSLPPAEPADPYRSYVIGALKPDDFRQFHRDVYRAKPDRGPPDGVF